MARPFYNAVSHEPGIETMVFEWNLEILTERFHAFVTIADPFRRQVRKPSSGFCLNLKEKTRPPVRSRASRTVTFQLVFYF